MTPEQAMAAIRAIRLVIEYQTNPGYDSRDEAIAVTALFNALTGQAASDEQIKAMVEV